MSFNKKVLLLLAVILFALPAFCDEKPWREIRSPHFRVITNDSETAGRHAAREFEQMRGLFAERFPEFRLDSSAPLVIMEVIDEGAMRRLVPRYWEHRGPKPIGVYLPGWEKEFAIVRADVVGSDRINADFYEPVYFEYISSLLRLNFHWLPQWLGTGLCRFYSYSRFEGERTYIGAPPKELFWMRKLENRPSMPLGPFMDQPESFTRDASDTDMFYAQSWAFVHYLTMAPGMGNGERLNRFIRALQQGTDQKTAFEKEFGSLETVQKDFDQYLRRFMFPAGVIDSPSRASDKTYTARMMSVAETYSDLGSYFLYQKRWEEARRYSQGAADKDATLALPHETLGFVNLHDGKDEEASQEFSLALQLDGKLYLSLFARTMLSPLAHSKAQADRDAFQSELMKVLSINPQFAPAFVELAKFYVAQGNLTRALALARTAEKFEPSRAGYHLLTGQILLRMGHPAEASAYAAYVANRWKGPDHEEALELWNRVPASERKGEVPTGEPPKEVSTAEGTVKSVTCKENEVTLTVDHGGQPLTFHFTKGTLGFSDTFWVGLHFTTCQHTTGLRVVVRYKPSTDKSVAGEVTSIAFRDDLPASPVAAEPPKTSAQSSPAESK